MRLHHIREVPNVLQQLQLFFHLSNLLQLVLVGILVHQLLVEQLLALQQLIGILTQLTEPDNGLVHHNVGVVHADRIPERRLVLKALVIGQDLARKLFNGVRELI